MNIISKNELIELRELRERHLTYGIGAIRDVQRYRDLMRRASEFILSLPREEESVMECLFLHGKSVIWTSFALHYSERQIRRIRKKVLDTME
jgi:hypothetical protein